MIQHLGPQRVAGRKDGGSRLFALGQRQPCRGCRFRRVLAFMNPASQSIERGPDIALSGGGNRFAHGRVTLAAVFGKAVGGCAFVLEQGKGPSGFG